MKRAGPAFLIFILSILVAPLGSEAQPTGKVYRIGYLSLGSPSDGVSRPFRDTLRQLGYVEAQNLLIESWFADAKVDQLPGLAADLVRRNVDLIVTIGTPPVQAAKEATATIPIVMAGSADPVEHGFVASLARPGGNVTGVTHSPGPEISGKGIELLKEAVPTVSRVAVLWDSSIIHEGLSLENQKVVARKLGVTLLPFDAKTLDELNAALVAISRERANGLFIFPNFINGKHAQLILDFAATNRLPTMFQETWWAVSCPTTRTGIGCVSGPPSSSTGSSREPSRATSPWNNRLTKFDHVVSLKTAKALGLTIPPSVLARADEVIE